MLRNDPHDRLVEVHGPILLESYDDENVVEEEVGLECANLEIVRDLAAISLAELARDVLPGRDRRVFAVKAHDGQQPALQATLAFEAVILIDR